VIKRILFIMLIGSLICGVSTAGATTIHVTLNTVDPWTPVNISGSLGSNVGTVAGHYVLDTDLLGQVRGFCVDPSWYHSNSDYYMIGIPDPKYVAAAYLLNLSQNYSGLQATEAQLAVWEVVWDWGNDSGGGIGSAALGADNFIINKINGSALTSGEITDILLMCNNAIAAANSGTFVTTDYRLLVSPDENSYFGRCSQDYIVKVVPEPLTLLLVGSGLIPFIRLRKKR